MGEKEVLNSQEAAEFLGIKPFTVRKYARMGIIPAKNLGKEWRFYKPDLIAWLREEGKFMPPTTQDFQNELNNILQGAQSAGLPHIAIDSTGLHRRVGGYPGPGHNMPNCCRVMKNSIQPGDQILRQPAKGQGRIVIRYRLPRPVPPQIGRVSPSSTQQSSSSSVPTLKVTNMTKMDMIWIATANRIHPQTSSAILVTRQDIEKEIAKLFQTTITPVMLEKHLVSWEDRQADKTNPSRGGSRNRYLFRTSNGSSPDQNGDFRLYKRADSQYDGLDKNKKSHPDYNDVDPSYHHLIDWYINNYF